MNCSKKSALAVMLCLLASCNSSEQPKARSIGEGYVGPATLPIRSELSKASETKATLKHGQRLEILQKQRSLLKVRNMDGVEGWVDARALISTQQMAELKRTIDQASKMPSQGRATVFDALNIHSEPNRSSPSPFQIPAGGGVDVLAHLVTARVPYQAPIQRLITPPKAPPKKPKKKKGKKGEPPPKEEEENPEVPLPPMPPAPKVPENWQELSKTDLPDDVKSPIKADDWTLVRTPEKNAGWVLMRMLYMAIPDDVAQYAEGKRISSYFSLGELKDEEKTKHHWLWTTLSRPLLDCDFDGMRLFIYNTKRHRYETAFRDNNVQGFFPVLRHDVKVTENKKTFDTPGFSVIVEDGAGQRWKRTYAFVGNRVRLLAREQVSKPKDEPIAAVPTAPSPQKKSWLDRLKQMFGK